MEGKETRFGIAASSLFAAVTTAASCGAVNAMHDSFTPLGGMVPMLLMQLGEVVFGGVGSGLYGMLVFAILAVFIAGLMIGRTPEYLGKKIESLRDEDDLDRDPGHAGAGAGRHGDRRHARRRQGRHRQPGRPRLLAKSCTPSARPPTTTAAPLPACPPTRRSITSCWRIAMWFGRFAVIVPILAIAGSLAAKPRLQANRGTMPTHGPVFVGLLVGVVLLVGVLNYVPALALGPVVEHLQLYRK